MDAHAVDPDGLLDEVLDRLEPGHELAITHLDDLAVWDFRVPPADAPGLLGAAVARLGPIRPENFRLGLGLQVLAGAIGDRRSAARLTDALMPELVPYLRRVAGPVIGRLPDGSCGVIYVCGRAAVTALMAGREEAAAVPARTQIERSVNCVPSWSDTGEYLLAHAVRARLARTGEERLWLLEATIGPTAHGLVHPLFGHLRLALARTLAELGRTGEARREAEVAWRFSDPDAALTGHLWDPRPLRPFLPQFPVDRAEIERFRAGLGG